MRYNLFNGLGDKAVVDNRSEKINEARHALSEARRFTRENVERAWSNLITARERVHQLHRRVITTQQVLVAYKKQFELGQRSLLNLVDTERELFNSKSDLINSQFLVLNSGYRLLASMGTLGKYVNR